MALLKNCCWCFGVQKGTIAIAALTLISSVCFIAASAINMIRVQYLPTPKEEYLGIKEYKAPWAQLVTTLLFGCTQAVCGVFLWIGAKAGMIGMMLPWMTVHTLLVIVLVVFIGNAVNDGVYGSPELAEYRFAMIYAAMIPLLLVVLCLLVVYSYCQTVYGKGRASELLPEPEGHALQTQAASPA